MLEAVRPFALEIDDGRTLSDVLDHMESEIAEARAEIAGTGDGADGITGEGIDILACALDFVILSNPDLSEADATEYLIRKCEKWVRKHRNGEYGDRSARTD